MTKRTSNKEIKMALSEHEQRRALKKQTLNEREMESTRKGKRAERADNGREREVSGRTDTELPLVT